MRLKLVLLGAILVLGVVLRFYQLGEVPAGFHQDEVSQAYNAFSILRTGKDRYGETLPVLFRSFGSYQPAVYTYLATVPIAVFGNTVFAARFTSAFFGVLIVLLTYLVVKELAKKKYGEKLALVASLMVAISPWAIHFSRRVVEGNLGLFFFLLFFWFFLKSLSNIKLFPLSLFILGVATQAYYSERLIALIFLAAMVIYLRSYFLKNLKWFFIGLLVFGLALAPHLITVISGAFAARFDQVSYVGNSPVVVEFFKHYFSYLSPRNLFSDIGSDLGRISPGLGVFYEWMFIPFLAGLYFFVKYFSRRDSIIVIILIVISLIPTALTGDVFYPLRALEFLWLLTLVASVGALAIIERIPSKVLGRALILCAVIYSLFIFYVSYFVLFKHETIENAGQTYIKLGAALQNYKDYNVVVDSSRDPAIGLRLAYLTGYDPVSLQKSLRPQMISPYYSSKVEVADVYDVGNVTARPISWKVDRCAENTIVVGDNLAISEEQIKEHNLKKVFELKSANQDFVLSGFSTHPDAQCIIK